MTPSEVFKLLVDLEAKLLEASQFSDEEEVREAIIDAHSSVYSAAERMMADFDVIAAIREGRA